MKTKNFNPKSTWFTSDIHFGHKNIMKYCPTTRPYCSVEDMDGSIIGAWNEKVKPGDDVFFLGDFSFHKASMIEKILQVLNGNIHIVYGNHDQVIRDNTSLQKYFASTQEYLEIEHDKTKICMFHYPLCVWNKGHHGAIHLHGHSHGEHDAGDLRKMDVGWDTANKIFSLEDIMEILSSKQTVRHHKKDCKLTIVRGAPGSGKTTFVTQNMNPVDVQAHFENDMYFTDADGNYDWDYKKMDLAAKWCFDNVRESLEAEKNTVVSNTFIKQRHLARYLDLARSLGVALEVVDVIGDYKSVHDVPLSVVEKMRNSFRPLDSEFVEKHYTSGNNRANYKEKRINTNAK